MNVFVHADYVKKRQTMEQDLETKIKSYVVIYSQISIFEPLETALSRKYARISWLWFAFKLVSLNHWKQQ